MSHATIAALLYGALGTMILVMSIIALRGPRYPVVPPTTNDSGRAAPRHATVAHGPAHLRCEETRSLTAAARASDGLQSEQRRPDNPSAIRDTLYGGDSVADHHGHWLNYIPSRRRLIPVKARIGGVDDRCVPRPGMSAPGLSLAASPYPLDSDSGCAQRCGTSPHRSPAVITSC